MYMATTKHWPRWTTTSQTKFFPKPKYGFSQHLKRVGDTLVTHPVDEAGYQKFKDAAKFWAWYHDKRVRIIRNKLGDGMSEVVIRLVAQHRQGDAHTAYSS
jgi:hypothetical protein